jgi:uncharacterized repeat protein (TIGR02543 family)
VTNEPLNTINGDNGSAIAAAVKIIPTTSKKSSAAAVKKTAAISKTSSIHGSASVTAVKVISATFSTPMDQNSISTSTFIVRQGTTPILGVVSYTDTTALFVVPNGLDPNLTYTCMITTGAKDVAGIALANIYVWSFTTSAITSPTVSSTDPANAATGVVLNKQITATFNKTMDASTITTASFTVAQGAAFIAGTVSYVGTSATFIPSSNLTSNTTYTATITTGAKDPAGNALVHNYVWSFTTAVITSPTVSSTDPVNGATGVALNQKIAATFSKTMDASTITASTFTLLQGTTPVQGFVSYSGTTAIFAPSNNLTPNTAYTATITTGAKDLAGNALANNYVWSFTTGAATVVTPPTVSSTDPVNAAIGVALNQKIAATFSKSMDASTITASSLTLKQGTTSVSGFVSYSGTTATFAPASNLTPNTVYTATITTGAKDLAGNALANNFVWSFTTGAAAVVTPPTISSTDPVNAAIGVALNQKIAATFSKTMDPSTIQTSTFTVKQGITQISGFVSYSGTTAIFTPASNLVPNSTYVVTITTGVMDLAGNALANNFVWSFTTGVAVVVTPPTVSSTDPVNAATGVALNQKIAATFSKSMDASTITASSFTLKQGSTPISGFVSYSGITAIFDPASDLSPSTLYTATITTDAKDLAGNALAINFVWSFTTGAATVVTPPTVSSTDPMNAATGVVLNQKIAATFSTTIDPSTLTSATFTLKQGTTSVSGFVSYSGITATFAPASNLAPNTVYTATISTSVKDLAGNALANNYVWSFTTGAAVAITPPVVSSTDPVDAAIGVALSKQIVATFSKTMDASTIQTSTFILMQGITQISGFVSSSGTTARFTPVSNLSGNTVYTATITTGAKDLAGNALANNYTWSFTTAAAVVVTPPTVSSTDPVNAATGVALNKQIAATFSKTMDASTITTATFTLMQGNTFVSGTVSYVGTTATYKPSSNLAPNTLYTATITTGAKDLAGNALVNNYVWSFTTGVIAPPTVSSTDPANGAICVALNKKIGATFSRPMNASTITTAIFTLMETQGARFVSGVVSYVDTTATFTPLINLTPNTNYTATITTEAWDLAGNPMSSNYVWTFTTVVPYTVTLSSNPPAGGTTSGGGTFNSCSSVTVTATPNTGYTFTNWTENGTAVSTDLNYTFTLNGNRTLVANFAINTYTLTVNATNGSVNKNPNQITYNYGSNVILTAFPTAGFTFTNWSGDATGSSNPFTVTMNANKNITANFDPIPQYSVTVSSNPAAGGSTGGGGTFYSGASVTVTATANSGYTFANWTEGVAIVSTNANYTFTISGNRILVANFTAVPPPPSIDLGLAATYGLAAYSAITNVPTSHSIINGDASIQINPITSMTGFTFSTPAGAGVVTGSVHAGDAVATQVYNALLAAYNIAKGKTPDAGLFVVGAVDLGTVDIPVLPGHLPGHLPPGVYSSASTMNINTNVVLDAGGDANAIWIFQIGSSLTTTSGSVTLEHGAQQKNVFFVPTASASIGTNTTFYGNILAGASITLAGNNTVFGRLLGGALGAGQIDMNGLASTITVP